MMKSFGLFLNVSSVADCQKIGTISSYSESSLECRVYVDVAQRNTQNCTFEMKNKLLLSTMWGYVDTNSTCDNVCLALDNCYTFRNDSGCILFSATATLADDPQSKLYTKLCAANTPDSTIPDAIPKETNNGTNTNAIVAVCIVGGLLLLVILFFIILHHKRARSKSERFASIKKSSDSILDKEILADDTWAVQSEGGRSPGMSSNSPNSDNFYGLNRNRSGPV